MIKGFAHIALYTAKFDETVEFYKTVFHGESMGCFETDVRGCWLKIGNDILEIFESDEYVEGGFKHFAIACDDIDELYEEALAKGAEEHIRPKDISLELNETLKARIAFVKGVNGEQIELFETK